MGMQMTDESAIQKPMAMAQGGYTYVLYVIGSY